jgi:hypothetical protein
VLLNGPHGFAVLLCLIVLLPFLAQAMPAVGLDLPVRRALLGRAFRFFTTAVLAMQRVDELPVSFFPVLSFGVPLLTFLIPVIRHYVLREWASGVFGNHGATGTTCFRA